MYETLKPLAVFNCIIYRLVHVGYLEIRFQVVDIFLKKRTQPNHIIPLIENDIEDIVKIVLISYCPQIRIVGDSIKLHAAYFSAKICIISK